MDSVEVETPEHENSEILDAVRKAKKEADKTQAAWREESKTCFDFVAGEQWNEQDRAALEAQLRVPTVFNRVGPMVDAVAGAEVNNRQQVQYIPRRVGDKGINEVLTGAADYIRDNCDAEDEESDAFVDAVICGVGVTETRLSYDDNPEGEILIERRDPLSMRWDPSAKKRNLMDRRWHQYDAWLTREEIEEKWPDADITPTNDFGSNDDESIHDQSLAWLYERDATGYDKSTGKSRVIHHQWWEMEKFYQVLDEATGQIIEVEEDQFETLNERAQKVGLPIQSVQKTRKRYKQAFVCGGTVLEVSDCPCNRFTFHFITAKRDRNKGIWYGIVRPMLDPQRWANKFFSQLLHIVNTNAKGGLLVEDDATDDMAKLKRDWAKADSVVEVNSGAISGGKIMPKPAPQIPPTLDNLLTFSISSLRDVTGINLELLGLADRKQAGILESQRKQAAMTVLASLFDALRRYRKEQGRTLIKFIQDYLSDGRLVRILGGDGVERYVPLIRDNTAIDADVVVDEAPSSVSQKERTFEILMQMLPNMANMGVPFTPELLDFSPLPTAMVEKWKQAMQQGANPQAMQQMQQAIQVLQQQLGQANQKLQSKEQEIQARMAEAKMSADSQLASSLEQARIKAQADYQMMVEKANQDAQTAIQKAIIDAQAKVTVAKINANPIAAEMIAAQDAGLAPEERKPDPMEQVAGALMNVANVMQSVVEQGQQTQAALNEKLDQAIRKPKRFNHLRGPDGFIVGSEPVFE